MTKKNFETMTLVYGTGNAAKLEIMKRYLAGFEKIRLVGLKELDFCWEEPEESGKDPLENARQKALAYHRICRLPVLSADSGLYIEGLSEEEQPGVYVRRVNGKNLNDDEMRAYYKGIAERFGGRCTAQYHNALCLVFSEDEIYESEASELSWDKFYLTTDERPQKLAGFPLDAISADCRTGRHYYDTEHGLEEDGSGYVRFFEEALAAHAEKASHTKKASHTGKKPYAERNEGNDETFVL